MPAPHRTFFYVFEDYKQNIFREFWQKGERRKLKRRETLMLVLFFLLPAISGGLYFAARTWFPKYALTSYIPMILEVFLTMGIAIYTARRNLGTLDEAAEQHYERWIKRLYDSLHEQDYDNQLSLAWIIQKCQEIIDQGCGLENVLKRFSRYYVVCILPVLSFCAAAILKDVPADEQCLLGIMGIGLLICFFALSQMIGPEIFVLASKQIRVAKELKEGAEYLLVQGDLEIAEKPRAALKREASASAVR